MSAVDTYLEKIELTDESLEGMVDLIRLARRFYHHEADAIDLAWAASAVLDAHGRNARTRGHYAICVMQTIVLKQLAKSRS